MVKITEELLRKKSEHNEGIIGTLEELSLHQENVERIEYLHNRCKDLQILLLQSNLIPKIENLNKLKMLQYLNLAINNIEKVENLEKCESLEKLDLTLNFIGDIESVCSLRVNLLLKHLYLVGNPCTDYEGYRQYVIAKLPQIQYLDSIEITRSERLKDTINDKEPTSSASITSSRALQIVEQTEVTVLTAQRKYEEFRAEQRNRLANDAQESLDDEQFWKASSEHAPETRLEISQRRAKHEPKKENLEKKAIKLFAQDGRPLNVNQSKLDFKLDSDNTKEFVLDIFVYRYLDTNLIDVDIEPNYVRVTVKGKVFQLSLAEEVYPDKSSAQRSQTTGHLVIKMPKVNYNRTLDIKSLACEKSTQERQKMQKNKYLEVTRKDDLDFSKIVENSKGVESDNSDVPPLEYG